MLGVFQRWLAVKLGLLITVAVAAGFTLAAAVGTRAMLQSSARLHRESASSLAASIGASIRTAMLSADGAHVRRLVAEVKSRLPKVGVRVFSAQGEEVFAAKSAPPPAADVPAHVRATIASGSAVATGPLRSLPLARGSSCAGCHDGGPVLGVLTVDRAMPGALDGAGLDSVAAIIRDGFYRIMLAPSAPRLDAYLAALSASVPGIRGAAVYAPDKSLAYGAKIVRGLSIEVRGLTLNTQPRCLGCHEDAQSVDGSTLVVDFDRKKMERPEALPALIAASLAQVMEAGLGRLAIGFLDDVAATGAVRALTLHDAEGRLYHDAFSRPPPPADVDSVLRSGRPRAVTGTTDAEFRFIEPLRNAKGCQGCHGTGERLRGAVEITLDTRAERAEIARLQRTSAAYALATIALVFLLLALGLYFTVIRPVRAIGSVADLVGAGRLDQTVDIRTTDEMGRLAKRVNEMVTGLRQKFELSKFVSHDTLREVEASVGAMSRGGERRRIAVVFSDIRGFTPFSEGHEPEAVVAMLNRVLHAQAAVIVRHGGDIDKFVGDEIMARFTGPDMTLRATRAAVEMVAAVDALYQGLDVVACRVGIGVNVGEAILGAMGAEQRMDFTAIGDTVNIAARLCSAAGAGAVLATSSVVDDIPGGLGLAFVELEPMILKGKQDAVAVYRVTTARPAA